MKAEVVVRDLTPSCRDGQIGWHGPRLRDNLAVLAASWYRTSRNLDPTFFTNPVYRMPGGTFTFIEYYKWKYDVTIEDPSQPLLRISNARARPDMRNPVSRLDETRGGQSVDEGPESPHHTPITGRGRNGGTSDEDDFASLPVINVTSLNPRNDVDIASTSAAYGDVESGEISIFSNLSGDEAVRRQRRRGLHAELRRVGRRRRLRLLGIEEPLDEASPVDDEHGHHHDPARQAHLRVLLQEPGTYSVMS